MDDNHRDLANAKQVHYSGRRIRTALAHFLLGRAASAIIAFLALLLLLRGLPIEAYGIYVTLMALQGMLLLLSALGLDATIDRFIPELRLTHTEASLQKAVLVALGVRLLILICLVAALGLTANWMATIMGQSGWHDYGPLLLTLILIHGLFNLAGNILDTLLLQKWSQMSGFVNALSRFGILAWAYSASALSVQTVLYAEIVSATLGLLVAIFALIRYFPGRLSDMRESVLFDGPLVRRVLRFASLNYGARVLNQTQGPHGLRLVVSHLHGVGAAATFGFAMSLADLLERYLPSTLLTRLIRPVFVSRYTVNRDFRQINGFASLLIKINLLLVAPAIMFSVFHGNHIVSWIGGEKYANAQWVLVMALALLVPNSHKVVIALVANTLEKNAMQFTGGVFAVIGLMLGIALSHEFALYGILTGALAAATAYNLYSIAYLRRQGYNYAPDVAGMLKILFASLTATGAGKLLGFSLPGLAGVLLAMLMGGLFYLLLLKRFNVFTTNDRTLLAKILPQNARLILRLL